MKQKNFIIIVVVLLILPIINVKSVSIGKAGMQSFDGLFYTSPYFYNTSNTSDVYYCLDPAKQAPTNVTRDENFANNLTNNAELNERLLIAFSHILSNGTDEMVKEAALRTIYNGLKYNGSRLGKAIDCGGIADSGERNKCKAYSGAIYFWVHPNALNETYNGIITGMDEYDDLKNALITLGLIPINTSYGLTKTGRSNSMETFKLVAGALKKAAEASLSAASSADYKVPSVSIVEQNNDEIILKINAQHSTEVEVTSVTGTKAGLYTIAGSYLDAACTSSLSEPVTKKVYYVKIAVDTEVLDECNATALKMTVDLSYKSLSLNYGVDFYTGGEALQTMLQDMASGSGSSGEDINTVSTSPVLSPDPEQVCIDPCPPYYVNSECDVKNSGTYIEGINFEENNNKNKDVKCIVNNADIAKKTKYKVNTSNGLITDYPSNPTKCSNVYCVEDYNYLYPGTVNVISGVYFKLNFSITSNINCFVRVESGGTTNDCDDWNIDTEKWFKTDGPNAIEVEYKLPDFTKSGKLVHLTTEKSGVSTSTKTQDGKTYIQKTATATAKYINEELKFEAQKGNMGTAGAEEGGTYGIQIPSSAEPGKKYKYEINVKNVGIYFDKATLDYGRIDAVMASSSEYKNIKNYSCDFSYGECTRSICVKSETAPGKCSICDADKNTGQPAGNCSAEMECEKVIPISDYTGDCERIDITTCPNDTSKTQEMCDTNKYEGKIDDVNSQCYKAMCTGIPENCQDALGNPHNQNECNTNNYKGDISDPTSECYKKLCKMDKYHCTDQDGKVHKQEECDNLRLDGRINEKTSECYIKMCSNTNHSCIEKNSEKIHYQFECDIRVLSGTLDDEGSECYKQLCDCTCPQCTFFSTGATTTITTTENGREFLFRQITTKNINPNDRQLGNNWSGIDANNPHLAIKAKATRALIDEEYAASTLSIDEIVTREGGGTPEALKTYTEVLKDVADEKATLKVKMTPNMIKDIKSYNNSNKTYVNTTLKCDDYKITSIKSKLQCDNNGYTWDETQNACLYKNAFCYSEFFDVYLNGKGYGTEEIKWNNRTTTTTLTLIGTTEDNVKIYSNDYWSIFEYTYLDTDGDGIPNIGPSWQ